MTLAEALAVSYFDEAEAESANGDLYVANVRQSSCGNYQVSLRHGAMPPYLYRSFVRLENVESFLSAYQDWEPLSPEEK